jgi:hypothetical protein
MVLRGGCGRRIPFEDAVECPFASGTWFREKLRRALTKSAVNAQRAVPLRSITNDKVPRTSRLTLPDSPVTRQREARFERSIRARRALLLYARLVTSARAFYKGKIVAIRRYDSRRDTRGRLTREHTRGRAAERL